MLMLLSNMNEFDEQKVLTFSSNAICDNGAPWRIWLINVRRRNILLKCNRVHDRSCIRYTALLSTNEI